MISVNEAVSIHNILIDKFGGAKGLRDKEALESALGRPCLTFENQELLDINETFGLEHIFSKKRQEMERGLTNETNLESLGNKIMLEEKSWTAPTDVIMGDHTLIPLRAGETIHWQVAHI